MHAHSSLKVAAQEARVLKKAHSTPAFSSLVIDYKVRLVMWQLDETLIRSHLDYCVQFWLQNDKKDVEDRCRIDSPKCYLD